ncbi:MAG: Uma2 family endonuclease [Deltaproteobacteria bacterium]|nr:Uma2 family endonuclease [Deltaproteobacteria bacterium]
MSTAAALQPVAPEPVVVYPDSDGQPMADNTEQFEFIRDTQSNLDACLPHFVAGDHLWYPVKGHPEIRVAPDVYVVIGRPKGHRGSYKQFEEGDVPLTVVFEWWSPNSNFNEQLRKHQFYERHGVQEFYAWDQARNHFSAFVREGGRLEPVNADEGWTSPLLGIRFAVKDDALHMFRPDGQPFRSLAEMEKLRDAAAAERDAAMAATEKLAAKLRELGIDPATLAK